MFLAESLRTAMASTSRSALFFCILLVTPCACGAEWEKTGVLDDLMDRIWTGSDSENLVATLQKSSDRDLAQIGTLGRIWLLHLSTRAKTAAGIVASPSASAASQPLRQFWPPEDRLTGRPFPVRVQVALLRAITGTDPTGVAPLETLGADRTGAERIRVMDAIARYHFYHRSYATAKSWVADGLKEYAVDNATYPIPATVRSRLELLQAAILTAERTDSYGPLWEAGREAALAIDRAYADLAQAALVRAEKLVVEQGTGVEPMLRHWIAYLRAKFLAHADDTTEFTALMKRTPVDTYGPWAGEILLWSGDSWLEQGRIEDAVRSYGQAITRLAQQAATPIPQDALPTALATVAAPPTAWYRPSRGGGREINRPEPGTLWNAQTSAWYVPYFTIEAIVKCALCDLIRGDRPAAVAGIERIRNLDPEDLAQTEKNMPSNYRRFSDGFANGGLFLSDDERGRVPKSAANELWLVEVDHELERWTEAENRIDRFRRRHRADGPDATAPATMLKASVREMRGDVTGAEKILRELLKRYPKAPSAARAGIRLSQITPRMEVESIPLLLQVAKDFPGSAWEEEADSHRADMLFGQGRLGESIELIDSLIEKTSSRDKRDFYQSQKEFFMEKRTERENTK